MIFKRIIMIGLGLFLITVLPLQALSAKGKPVKPLKQWSGSVDDLSLQKAAPEIIVAAPELEKLWQAWKVSGPAPKVDFAQKLVVVTTTRGSRLRFGATLDEKGNLQVAGMATRDLRPGFRYVIAVVNREGVKTVNGKELTAAGAKSSANPTQDRDIKDFGVTDVEVRSVKSLDVEKLNREIAAAQQSGKAWPQQAVLVALKCSSEGLKGHTKAIEARTPPEQGQEAVVTVTESGYLDDAIGGERWRLWLTQDPKGTWTVKRALWAQLCQRPTHTYYSADACP
jgi:hypothetical protein